MQHAEENFQVEGNREVQAFLQRWLQRAQEGKLNFVGLIACKSATETFCDHVGVIGTEFAANFAVDNLKMQIMGNVFRRLPPEVPANAPANKVVYNLASGPCSFDFLAWLQTQEMRRALEKAEGPLEVAFSMGADQNLDRSLITDQRKIMFENVMGPLIPMLGAVHKPIKEIGVARWPETYTLNSAVELYNAGAPMPRLTVASEAAAKVDAFLKDKPAPVVITLRESGHWPHRNSNIPEWLKFADYLMAKGEHVIFLRDSAKANEPLAAGEGLGACQYATLPPCSLEINSRVALYERAKANIFCANGPATLCHFLSNPWFMVAPLDPSGAYPPGRPEWWLPHHGIPAFGQFPWSGPNQRIIWELDFAETLIQTWEQFCAGEFNEPAPKNTVSLAQQFAIPALPQQMAVPSGGDSGLSTAAA